MDAETAAELRALVEAKLQGQPLATSAMAVVLPFLQALQESLAARGQPAAARPAEEVGRTANSGRAVLARDSPRSQTPGRWRLLLNSDSEPALNWVGVSVLAPTDIGLRGGRLN